MNDLLLVSRIQCDDLLEKFFLFINKGLIREILDKLEEGFYPPSISMDDEGNVLLDGKVVEMEDFTNEQLEWFGETSGQYIGGLFAPFALIGCINRLKQEYERE